MVHIMAAAGRFNAYTRRAGRFLRHNAGQFAYYGAVALALCLIAYGAQCLRNDRVHKEADTILPVAEISEAEVQENKTEFHLPENYALLREYSDFPVWNADMGCWQTHPAADYTVDDLIVRSLCEGKVRSVGEDALSGGYVEVEAGGYLLRYASVDANDRLSAGMTVSAGEEIGRMDSSLPGEAYMQPHLHLEIRRNDGYVNPAQLK